MPSPKDPTVVVQPGPGRLPANTAPASAFITPPGGSSSAALAAHIADPVGAHQGSAIAIPAGPNWADGDTNVTPEVQARLDEIISDLTSGVGGRGMAKLTANVTSFWADTNVPAPGTGADVLNNIVSDLAHVSTAVNKIGGHGTTTGDTRALAAQPTLADILQNLTDLDNINGIWVLDAAGSNPQDADFIGANALITAMAKANRKEHILYLRSGTYNWDDSQDFSQQTVVGSDRSQVNIVAAGQMRVQDTSIFENVHLDVTTNILVQGYGECTFRNVELTVGGSVSITGSAVSNRFESVQGLSGGVDIFSASRGNVFTDIRDCQIELDSAASWNTLRNWNVESVPSLTSPVITVDGDHHDIANIEIDGLTNYDDIAIRVNGNYNAISNVLVQDFITPTANFKPWDIEGDYNRLTNVVSQTCPIPGAGPTVEGDYNTLDGIALIDTGDFGTDSLFRVGQSGLVRGLKIRNMAIDGVPSNTNDSVLPLVMFQAVETLDLDGLTFSNLGTVSDLRTLSNSFGVLLRLGQVDSSTLRRVYADGDETQIRAGHFLHLNSTGTNSVVSECYCSLGEAQSDVHTFLADSEWSGVVENSYFAAIGGNGAASVTHAVFRTLGANGLTVKNCWVVAGGGRAAAIENSDVAFEDCLFADAALNVWESCQLFWGYGSDSATLPTGLRLRDCRMLYSASNIDPETASGGLPVVTLGGSGTTVAPGHGATVIDGLTVTAFGLTGTWNHRASILAIDLQNGQEGTSLKRVTVDLAQVPFLRDGNNKGFDGGIAAAIELHGYESPVDGYIKIPVEDLSVINMQNFHANIATLGVAITPDQRHAIRASGVAIDGLVVDGAPDVVEARSTGSFTAVAAAGLSDGDTFTINDGTNPATTFEFDLGGGGVAPGNVPVVYGGGEALDAIRDLMIAAIQAENGVNLLVDANRVFWDSTQVGLTNWQPGTVGNAALASSVLAFSGMSGGGGEPIAGGAIIAQPGSALVDGQIFTLRDGKHQQTVFEFDSGGGVATGHVPVPFTGGDSEAVVAGNMETAINSVAGAPDQLELTALAFDITGFEGVAIAQTAAGHYGCQWISTADGGAESLTTGAFEGASVKAIACDISNLDLFPQNSIQIKPHISTGLETVAYVEAEFCRISHGDIRNLAIGSTANHVLTLFASAANNIAVTSLGGRAVADDDESPNSVQPFCSMVTGGNTFLQAFRLVGLAKLRECNYLSTSPSFGNIFSAEISCSVGFNEVKDNVINLACPNPGDQSSDSITKGAGVNAIGVFASVHDQIVNNTLSNSPNALPGQSGLVAIADGVGAGGNRVSVTGLTGMDSTFAYASDGRYLTLFSPSNGNYTGTWVIATYGSPAAVTVYNNPGDTDAATGADTEWVEVEHACCPRILIVSSQHIELSGNNIEFHQIGEPDSNVSPADPPYINAVELNGFLGPQTLACVVASNKIRNLYGGYILDPSLVSGGVASISLEFGATFNTVQGNTIFGNNGAASSLGIVRNMGVINLSTGADHNTVQGNTLTNWSSTAAPVAGSGSGGGVVDFGAGNITSTADLAGLYNRGT